MKYVIGLLAALLLSIGMVSASSINLHGDQDTCYADGPLYGGDIAGWGVPAVQGGNYGSQGYDTFCLVIEPEQCDMYAHVAGIRVTAADGPLNTITVKYLDGISDADDFFITITDETDYPHIIGWVYDNDPSVETWETKTFALPFTIPEGETRYLRFEAQGPIWEGCKSWGQLAIDSVDFGYDQSVPEFSVIAGIIALSGALTGVLILRKKN